MSKQRGGNGFVPNAGPKIFVTQGEQQADQPADVRPPDSAECNTCPTCGKPR